MAYIYIRGRKDPLTVSNERARNIKKARFGDAEGKGVVDPRTGVDLGDWAGEIGMIRIVETEREKKYIDKSADEERERLIEEEKWLALPAEEKARGLGMFKIGWSVAHGFSQSDPPQAILDKAYQIQLKYFRENPKALRTPREIFQELLPNKKTPAAALADKMSIKNINDIPQ